MTYTSSVAMVIMSTSCWRFSNAAKSPKRKSPALLLLRSATDGRRVTSEDAGDHSAEKWRLELAVHLSQTFEYQTVVGHGVQYPR